MVYGLARVTSGKIGHNGVGALARDSERLKVKSLNPTTGKMRPRSPLVKTKD